MRSRLFHFLRKTGGIAFFLVAGALVLDLDGCIPLSELSFTGPTPVFVTHAPQQANGLTQLWSRDDVYELQGEGRLDAFMSTGCFVGDLGEASRYDQLICFNDETGKVNWMKESATNGLVVVTPIGVFEADLGDSSSGIDMLDLQTGAMIWQKKFFDSNPIGLVFFNDQIQLITWKPGRKLWVFDTNGNVLKVINNTYTFLTTPEITFTSETGVRALRTGTNDVIWDYIDTGLARKPIVTSDKLFCRSESHSGIAYALDRNTGRLLWQVQDIVYGSGLAYSPDKRRVYALRSDGDLLAIDENTGEINIAAKFSSPQFLPIINGTAEAYELAYDQEQHILLVSFGDSHQLFAFREIKPS
jgi:outer membrane protein assembly factor BamB